MENDITITATRAQGLTVTVNPELPPRFLDNEMVATMLRSVQLELRRVCGERLVSKMLSEAHEWAWPRDHHQLSELGPCVYFAFCRETRPGQIKIGYTYALKNRRIVLGDEYKERPHILAYVKHDDCKALERALHHMFCYDLIAGDWFRDEPVLAWLDMMTRIPSKERRPNGGEAL
jgi:hypothetical protein